MSPILTATFMFLYEKNDPRHHDKRGSIWTSCQTIVAGDVSRLFSGPEGRAKWQTGSEVAGLAIRRI